MKLLRYGAPGAEKPGMLDADGVLRDLSGVVGDIAGDVLSDAGLARLRALDPASLPKVAGNPRIGPCVGQIGKFCCIGLNYADHAAESNLPIPEHPILFMKANSAISGPHDTVMMPRGSTKTDWEVELGVVIGTAAKYVSEADALSHVAGYCVINDVSERDFQTKLTGQWTKGKSCDTFGPIGPWLVTRDEIADIQALDMHLDVNGKRMQTGNSRTMIFTVAQIIAHLSTLFTLHPGDVISTGTPPGVGMGIKPDPVYLKKGDVMELSIAGLGTQRQVVGQGRVMAGKTDLLLISKVMTDRMRSALEGTFNFLPLYEQADQQAWLAAHGAGITAVLTDGHWGVRPDVMQHLPDVKVISCYGVGYDNINAVDCAARGIMVTHTPNVLNAEVANTAILLWLATSRRLVRDDRHVRDGKWPQGNAPLTRSVDDRKVGILGLGRIGEELARRIAVFNPDISYHSRNKKADSPYRYYPDLVAMARDVDVLFCITPGGAATHHLVNRAVMDALGPDGTLINVGRGTVVDEAELVKALQDGRLGNAGLDVFEKEPQVPAALFGMDQVTLLPHVGSATVETRAAMGDLACNNLLQFMRDGTVISPVPECQRL